MQREIIDGSRLHSDLELEADVVIIGTGAGGAVTAEILSQAGLRVILLEEGAYRCAEDFGPDEVRALSRLYFYGGQRPTTDRGVSVVQGRTVGGSTTVNWTACIRPPRNTLEYWSGVLGLTEFGSEQMTPWLVRMEKRLRIEPAIDNNPNNQALARGAERLGWSAEPIPRNVEECAVVGRCGLGCPRGAKLSMELTTIPAALDAGAVLLTRVRAAARVNDLALDADDVL